VTNRRPVTPPCVPFGTRRFQWLMCAARRTTTKSLTADAARPFVVFCLMVSVITVTEKEHPV
jgi:hypothetical protein